MMPTYIALMCFVSNFTGQSHYEVMRFNHGTMASCEAAREEFTKNVGRSDTRYVCINNVVMR